MSIDLNVHLGCRTMIGLVDHKRVWEGCRGYRIIALNRRGVEKIIFTLDCSCTSSGRVVVSDSNDLSAATLLSSGILTGGWRTAATATELKPVITELLVNTAGGLQIKIM